MALTYFLRGIEGQGGRKEVYRATSPVFSLLHIIIYYFEWKVKKLKTKSKIKKQKKETNRIINPLHESSYIY
jgi:hypothetical protein